MINTTILVLATLAVLGSPLTTYYYNFDTLTKYTPSYKLGNIQAGTTIYINVTTTGVSGPNAYTVSQLVASVEPDSFPTSPISCTGSCISAFSCSGICSITLTQNYRLNITRPSNPADTSGSNPKVIEHFQILVTSLPTVSNITVEPTTLLKATDIYRDRLARLIYISSYSQVQFSLYPAAQTAPNTVNLLKTNLHLYKINSITGTNNVYDAKISPQILTNASLAVQSYSSLTKTLTYNTSVPLTQGFYMLVATFLVPNTNLARLIFSSDSYSCPYDMNFPDYYSNFQGCTTPNPIQPGFPCLTFDYIKQVCTGCAATYTLINGTCSVLTLCPERQYFKFGTCYPVDDSCLTYDIYSGYCLTCVQSNRIIVQGKCVYNITTDNCGPRQYLFNNTCVNISILCDSFNRNSGECLTCVSGAILSNITCVAITITCRPDQYLYNYSCIDIPAICAKFNFVLRQCDVCIGKYYLSNGVCLLIVCPKRYYISNDNKTCKQVSQLCDQYDDISGQCLTCKYSGYTVVKGACLQVTSPLVGCQERQKLGFGPCGDNTQNCNFYNLLTNNCQQCVTGWYLDYTGKCTLQNAKCKEDEVSVQGICVQRPANCLKVDNLGLCVACNGSNYQIQMGQCAYVEKCPPNMFLQYGSCVYVTPGCAAFNPTSGQCLTCIDGRTAVEGLCCPQGQVAFHGLCYDEKTLITSPSYLGSQNSSEQPRCIAYHPTMNYCLQCNGHYEVDQTTMTTCI